MPLNSSQLQAIESDGGPTLIVAGPGSGKTTTLTLRIAYLIRENLAKPSQILALTFTQKAAKEITERVQTLQEFVGKESPMICTFHGLANTLIRENPGVVPGTQDFEIVSEGDQKNLVRELLKKAPNAFPALEGLEVRDVLLALSRFKNGLNQGYAHPEMAGFAEVYQKELEAKNRLDFDDLLLKALQLLEGSEEILKRYQSRFLHILVDEYQDTNAVQDRLLHLLAGDRQNIFAIGDPDQAIYAFRGANRENFTNFQTRYPNSTLIRLNENYRCPHNVAKAAYAVIQNNPNRLGEFPVTIKETVEPVQIIAAENHYEEESFVVKTIQSLIEGTDHEYTWKDIVVLYRTHSVGESLAQAMDHAGIPYERVGEASFFDHKEIREFLEKVKARHNWGGINAVSTTKTLSGHLQELMTEFGLRNERYDLLLELLNWATAYNDLPVREAFDALLADAALTKSDEDWANQNKDAVRLMTFHAAKGLEFPVVFLAGLEDGVVPYLKHESTPDHLEEERRLFYVGMTRAMDRLYLSYAKERTLYGEKTVMQPSRFLEEIPSDLVEVKALVARERRKLKKEEELQPTLF
ncbi:MAG: ATP-dependent helicase [Candidatus Gracilibacteria bacterium]